MRVFTAPGKLIVAGEYGVVLGAAAVVSAVNRRARVTVVPARSWSFAADPDSPPGPIAEASPFVLACFDRVAEFCGLPEAQTVTADTRAFAGDNGKYGLGSSAALSVALVTALLALGRGPHFEPLAETPDPGIVFQLAFAAHRQAQGSGSGIDVAASAFGGMLLYVPPDHVGAPGTDWSGLRIERLAVPADWRIAVAWSGKSASTQQLLEQVEAFWQAHPDHRFAFLKASSLYAKAAAQGLADADWHPTAAALRLNRRLLADLGAAANVVIETPALHVLAELAETAEAAAKLSGAGGGDCALTLAPAAIAADVEAAWRQAGFDVLDLAIDPRGACEEL